MTLKEMKKKVLGMIEELNPSNAFLTDDTDIATKINDVINQVMFEVARMKKIPAYVELSVTAGESILFSDIKDATSHSVYQLDKITGIDYEVRASGTVIVALDSGKVGIDYFRYPTVITEETTGDYEFELSEDALEIIPYGVAGDLLKSDVSANYGQIYSARYETMLQRLDPRYNMGSFYIEGGVNI